MYDDLSVEEIKSEIIGLVSTDIDTREGSFFNDMISAVAYELWKVYQGLDAIVPIAYIDETSGEYIDKRCAEYGIVRKEGTKATTVLNFTGTTGIIIPQGKVFLNSDGLEFISDKTTTIVNGLATVTATASEIGKKYNVEAGTITKQFTNLSGLTAVTNNVATGGTDAETDASLVARLYEYLQRPASSGNVNHYKQWALAVDGVGSAKVTPLWDGPGTVRVLIAGSDKKSVDATVVQKCADYIEENRPIGATVTVVSATELDINIEASVTIENSITKEIVQEEFETALENYLSSIAFESYTVVYNRIAYILLDIDGVIDYTTLKINGGTTNIAVDAEQVPIVGTVVVE